MAKIKIPLHSFQFGELSPSFTSRVDAAVYQAGAQKVRNFIIINEGGVKKRAGGEFVYKFGNTVTPANELEIRIEPFIFSDDEQYIFCFKNNSLDIFFINPTTGEVDTTPVSLSGFSNCPWTTAKLKEITMASSGDVTIICHETFPPRLIRRTGLKTFVSEVFEFEDNGNDDSPTHPYYKFQKGGVTLDPAATSGTGITVVASSDYFVSGHVGSYLLIGNTPCEIKTYVSATEVTVDITGTILRRLAPDSIEVFAGTGAVQVTMPLHGMAVGDSFVIDRVGALGGLNATHMEGTKTVSKVIDLNTFEYTAGSNASSSAIGGGSVEISSAAATPEWYEQSYSAVRGYPAAVTFHEGRLWFAGTTAQPGHVWASKSANFFNFDIGTGADSDAIDLNSNFGEFSHIRHLVVNRDLQIFSASSESFIPAFTDRPVTPANAIIKRQTPYGSSYMRPQPFDGATLYTQASGKMLGSYVYSEVEQAYNTENVSVTATHLMRSPIQSASIKGGFDRAESYCFLINNDGTMSVFYSSRGDQRAGWMLWDTSGKFHSVCAVDRNVYCIAVRDQGDGTNRYYLEKFNEEMPMDYCDEFSGTAGVFDVSNQFSDGAVVRVVSGTDYIGEFTVASGEVDVSSVKEITTAYIGYQFTPILQTMPIDALMGGGPITAAPRKIDMVTLDLQDTLSASVNSKDMIIRNVNDDFSLDRSKFTGRKEFRLIGISKDPSVTVSQSVPFDLQLNGMVIEVTF